MCNPVRAGTHPSKAHFDSHPLSDEHRRATHTSRVTVHPQQSTARPANLGTKQHWQKALVPLVPPPSLSHPSAHKSLLAGSWEAAANDSFAAECRKSPFNPACCCLSPCAWQKDRCGQHASHWEDPVKTQQGIWHGPMLVKHHSQKTPFGFGCSLGIVFKQLDACTDFFSSFTLKIQGSIPKTILSLLSLYWRYSTFPFPAIQAQGTRRALVTQLMHFYTCAWEIELRWASNFINKKVYNMSNLFPAYGIALIIATFSPDKFFFTFPFKVYKVSSFVSAKLPNTFQTTPQINTKN